ncbi:MULTISPECIES: DUF2188 domain-containing protein [unclassified Microbacterium]|uniref:DUF2188 domain-containing protein n=1 Tax=unclassified Microbacterium TaxID=2609290 RepID=UPI0016051050|nr:MULTISPECIES: DUF2188 domain-containing protein [unclassified Microbacterium]QNA94215.1 DUF2188 domain-containing protein [Microbacterium sp. Se63.02b]
MPPPGLSRRTQGSYRRDGFKVTSQGKVTDTVSTQKEAEARAKAQVSGAGGGQVYIHRRDGTIRDADTVYPGNQSSARDTKH